jgi:hypothetical protein
MTRMQPQICLCLLWVDFVAKVADEDGEDRQSRF